VRDVPVTMHSTGRSGCATPLVARLAGELRHKHTLGDVLAWARAQLPPRVVNEVVTQDEYTHDVVMAWADCAWLVFDTT